MKRYCFVHKVSSLCEVEVLLVEQAMLFVPLFKTIWPIDIMHYLLPLRPAHPFGFGTLHDADHLIRSRKLGVDGGRKRVNQFGPVVIPQPQHRLQLEQKFLSEEHFDSSGVPRSLMAVYFLTIVDSTNPVRNKGAQPRYAYLIRSLPFFILSESATPPRFTLPLYPPTLRQMLQAQSW